VEVVGQGGRGATARPAAVGQERRWRSSTPVDVLATLAPLRRGSGDPTFRLAADSAAVWRTAPTPEGPATYRLTATGDGVSMTAWGRGATWVLDRLPTLLGDRHGCEALRLDRPLLREAVARHAGLRTPATGLVFEALAAAVLEQKVTGRQARQSWRELLRWYGEPAPGPAPPGVVPPAQVWQQVPSLDWHRAGVDGKRAQALVSAARVAGRLEESVGMCRDDAQRRLRAVPGIGVWTVAEVAQRALGDCDAVSFGDFHVPAFVGWALLGRPVDDAGLARLLEPYRPHRYRVVRLLELSGFRKPRFGPRATIADHRAM
jgi:3-methyladenine DNA glycosylase/8-oxoguanine DNA glycosylase